MNKEERDLYLNNEIKSKLFFVGTLILLFLFAFFMSISSETTSQDYCASLNATRTNQGCALFNKEGTVIIQNYPIPSPAFEEFKNKK